MHDSDTLITTLNAKAVLSHLIRAGNGDAPLKTHDGFFADPDISLHTERHQWCPLFDQLSFCLDERGMPNDSPAERFKQWFMYVDFSKMSDRISSGHAFLSTPYGRAMRELIDHGFAIEDDLGRRWHYTVFDKSASNARNSVISFLADTGYDPTGNKVHLYDELNQRLNLDIDFEELKERRPEIITWNKYYAYRALYLSTAKRIPLCDGLELTKESVLVIDTGTAQFACDVRRAQTHVSEKDGKARISFFTQTEQELAEDPEKQLALRLFDGEGLIAPECAAHLRSVMQPDGHSAQPSSFQIRMPFAKGVVHEVDFQRFIAEALGLDREQCASLVIEDAFGVERRLSDARIILTTDMLKCHAWLKTWVELQDARSIEHSTNGSPDPMGFYFAEMRKYGHALYVLSKRRRMGATREIATNAQYLSTLRMNPGDFTEFAQSRFKAVSEVLFDVGKARSFLLSSEEAKGAESDAMLCALEHDERFVYDPYIQRQLAGAVNAKLVDCASGKLPVKGTFRMLSHDLLAFLCMLASRVTMTGEGAPDLTRLEPLERECLGADALYLPSYEGASNDTGWLAVFRNPHLSRSEQCVLRPLEAGSDSIYEEYFGHLEDVVMASCASPMPMILGGADYDGDTVHIYDDDAIVRAVLDGAYLEPGCRHPKRRYPIADLSGPAGPHPANAEGAVPHGDAPETTFDEAIGRHISCDQLLRSFQSNVGILSNSAMRLSTVLYGQPETQAHSDPDSSSCPDDDVCANYTLAVGIDIDSVKTGVRLDMSGLRISNAGQDLSLFGISGKMVPRDLGFIRFRKEVAPALKRKGGRMPVWDYAALDDSQAGKIAVYLGHSRKRELPDFTTLDLEADLDRNDALKGASISNIQRLPWILVQKAKRLNAEGSASDRPTFIRACRYREASPLAKHAKRVSAAVDRDTLKAIGALVRSYHRVMWRLKEQSRKAKAAQGSKAFGKARRRAQEYPTQFTEDEIDAILVKAMGDIRDHLSPCNGGPTCADAIAAFKESGFTGWAICPAEERRHALQSYLPGLEFSDDFYALLENDGLMNGFMIPFYLVGAAQAAQEAHGALEPDGDDVPERLPVDARMLEELTGIVADCQRASIPRSAMEAEMRVALKDRILSLLPPQDHLVDYLCVLRFEDRNGCFSDAYYDTSALFWELLTADDLKEALA